MDNRFKPFVSLIFKIWKRIHKEGFKYRLPYHPDYSVIVESSDIYCKEIKNNVFVFFINLNRVKIYDNNKKEIVNKRYSVFKIYINEGYINEIPMFKIGFVGNEVKMGEYGPFTPKPSFEFIVMENIVNMLNNRYTVRYLPLMII